MKRILRKEEDTETERSSVCKIKGFFFFFFFGGGGGGGGGKEMIDADGDPGEEKGNRIKW